MVISNSLGMKDYITLNDPTLLYKSIHSVRRILHNIELQLNNGLSLTVWEVSFPPISICWVQFDQPFRKFS